MDIYIGACFKSGRVPRLLPVYLLSTATPTHPNRYMKQFGCYGRQYTPLLRLTPLGIVLWVRSPSQMERFSWMVRGDAIWARCSKEINTCCVGRWPSAT